MKITTSYFLTFLVFFYSFVSCAPSSDKTDSIQEDANLKYEKMADQYLTNIAILENDLQTNRNPIPTEFDQATIDYYSVLLGYEPGDFSDVFINGVIEKMGVASTDGINAALEEYELEDFTKSIISQISNGNTINDLSALPEFLSLNQNEKDLLQMANTITQAEINSGRSCEFGGGIGAVLGALIGGVLCGPLCVVGGAVLGGAIGCGADGGK